MLCIFILIHLDGLQYLFGLGLFLGGFRWIPQLMVTFLGTRTSPRSNRSSHNSPASRWYFKKTTPSEIIHRLTLGATIFFQRSWKKWMGRTTVYTFFAYIHILYIIYVYENIIIVLPYVLWWFMEVSIRLLVKPPWCDLIPSEDPGFFVLGVMGQKLCTNNILE